ncbi:P-loop containing nucleoside triphosphate hydrolase protein [Rhizoclosmatium globosum]|uniref:p-loop containing nucleoside triphosphate hydrolase protein n=1 Tax=Rhizoclosmatium globosum TaxID=329046 RepID=A0A1Y2BSG0_9FUNG|nr:P-loop containing nucleoside triphosphate hydrolase protein [Rhizoclosmatium globosum]|eukprot:ORY37644.1 P-loop containing nucleoside triphosphate hydrolase protein [Rhizoclosmatium globosum]
MTRITSVAAFAANTDLGKTLFSAALCRGAALAFGAKNVAYVKPVQTGFPTDSDSRYWFVLCCIDWRYWCGLMSPHLAAIEEKRPISDDAFKKAIQEAVQNGIKQMDQTKGGFILVETAGGVHSPTASGTLQSDVYKSLSPQPIPSTILIGDSRLGGISTTLCSHESLRARGFSVPLVLLFENKRYLNHEVIRNYVDANVVVVPTPPERPVSGSATEDRENLLKYFSEIDETMKQTVMALALAK